VQAFHINILNIGCVPPAGLQGTVALHVGYDKYEPAMEFGMQNVTFYSEIIVDSVQPTFSPEDGGATVTIRGRNFWPGMLADCAFGSYVVPATILSNGSVHCSAPRAPAGGLSVPLRLLVNNKPVKQQAGTGIGFSYRPYPIVESLRPSSASLGDSQTVTVIGQNFFGTLVKCTFGGSPIARAAILTSTMLLCNLPAAQALGTVDVSVSIDDIASLTTAEFYATRPLSVTAVQPGHGPLEGNTLVTVFGANFPVNLVMFCRFGSYAAVKAEWISNSSVHCLTPRGHVGNRTVEVSANGGATYTRKIGRAHV
jgi:hypothetical protein